MGFNKRRFMRTGKGKTDFTELIDDLMVYTDFKNVDEIKTKGDLMEFFDQVKEDSSQKGARFHVSHTMVRGAESQLNLNPSRSKTHKRRWKEIPMDRSKLK